MSKLSLCTTARLFLVVLAFASSLPASSARADTETYRFMAPPSIKANTMWRVEVATGAVGLCYFTKAPNDPIGATGCPKPGEGAGRQQEAGPYGVVGSNHQDESGIFRVNYRTGAISICYTKADDKGERIVCTAQPR